MIDAMPKPECRLANTEGNFVLGTQSSPVPMLLIAGAAGHNVLTANSSFLRMVGKEDYHIIGQPLSLALTALMDAQSIAYLAERLSLNQLGTWAAECSHPDGSIKVINIFDCPVLVDGSPLPQHVLCFHVSTENAAQSRPSSDELRTLYTHAPGFLAITQGPDHRISFANNSFKQYVGKRQLEGLTVADAMPETIQQGFVALLDTVFATGIPYHGRAVPYDFPDVDSGEMTRRYGDFVYAAVRDENSNIVGILCQGYDVTRQKEAEAAVSILKTKVAHTSRVNAMGTMAATMAHELNQPLTAILNFATGALRVLDRPELDVDAIRHAITSVQESSERAAAIIRTLRNLTDRRSSTNSEFPLKAVVIEALNVVRNGCSIDTQLHADIPTDLFLNADRVQIQQVIINLVRNGCDAVSGLKEQKVSVAAQATADQVTVTVRDTGQGLAVEAARDMFTWMDSSKESGMGLGLSICRTIVESHGGRIWLEDTGAGGTEFRFTLPRKTASSLNVTKGQL